MSPLHDALTEYLATRRALGTQLRWPASSLRAFVDFVEAEGAQFITAEIAVRWAVQPVGVQRATHARRLTIVRGFAAWLQATDTRTQVPAQRLLPAGRRRPVPHIYSEREITDLMAAATRLRSASGLRRATFRTLLGLQAATGLRPGEALALDVKDVDLAGGILAIRDSKFDKSRFVPLEESARAALAAYAEFRDAVQPGRNTPAFLVTERGARLHPCAARRTFATLCQAVGLRPRLHARHVGWGPRLQDFRHTFATRRLILLYRAGLDVDRLMPRLATYLGHVGLAETYWYIQGGPRTPPSRDRAPGGSRPRRPPMTVANLPALLQRFFTDRLQSQLGASPHTTASYRDAFRLLLVFASERLKRSPSRLCVEDLDPTLIGTFLDHLEHGRTNSPKTRNTRLAALRAFFRFVAYVEPSCSLQCQRILAIPTKRHERRPGEFLTEEETVALIAAPDPGTWIGRRDRTVLLVAAETGLRNAEVCSLRRRDVSLGVGAHVRCVGKGRKLRCTPLRHDVAAVLGAWLAERTASQDDPVFPNSRGGFLSADALQRLVARHVAVASATCSSLAGRSITPHTLRHTTAMTLLQRGVDQAVIALWLGHESAETTQIYLHADMRLKERALQHADTSGAVPARFRPTDRLLAFLENL